jgi:hypothetical protein
VDETILTRHPEGNQSGVQLTRNKYNLVRDAMLRALSANTDMTLRELTREVDRLLWGRFNASIPWYVKTIKLDLQARHVIEEVQVRRSRRLRLVR